VVGPARSPRGRVGSGLPVPAAPAARERGAASSTPGCRGEARDPGWVARHWEARLARSCFPADVLPVAWPSSARSRRRRSWALGRRTDRTTSGTNRSCRTSRPPAAWAGSGCAGVGADKRDRTGDREGFPRPLSRGHACDHLGARRARSLRGEEGLLVDMALDPAPCAGGSPKSSRSTGSVRRLPAHDPPRRTMCFGYFMLWDTAAWALPVRPRGHVLPRDVRGFRGTGPSRAVRLPGPVHVSHRRKQALVHLEPLLAWRTSMPWSSLLTRAPRPRETRPGTRCTAASSVPASRCGSRLSVRVRCSASPRCGYAGRVPDRGNGERRGARQSGGRSEGARGALRRRIEPTARDGRGPDPSDARASGVLG